MFRASPLYDFGAILVNTIHDPRSAYRFDGVVNTPFGQAWILRCLFSDREGFASGDIVLVPESEREGWLDVIPSWLTQDRPQEDIANWDGELADLIAQTQTEEKDK